MKRLAIILLLIIFSSTSCYARTKLSTDAMREMQTAYFSTEDTEKVIQAAVNTLQDSDFIIQDIDYNLGYIRARKTFKSHYVNKKRIFGWSTAFVAATAYTVFSYGSAAYSMYSPSRRIMTEMKDKTVVIDSNVFVNSNPEGGTKVRFLVVEKILQNADGFSFVKAAPIRVFRFYNPELYQEFFSQMKNIVYNQEV